MPTALSQTPDLSADFRNVDFWIFDLDNTLYPQSVNLLGQMRSKTYDYMCSLLGTGRMEAANLYERFEAAYGTSMNGLMIEHNIDPNGFLDFVHDIDHDLIEPNLQLAEAIRALPGRSVIYTNGTVDHAEKVLKRLGITDVFENIFDIVWADLDPKTHRAPFERLFAQTGADPTRAAMFEDSVRNLEIPFSLGVRTVLIRSENSADGGNYPQGAREAPDHVDYVTPDLCGFLSEILGSR